MMRSLRVTSTAVLLTLAGVLAAANVWAQTPTVPIAVVGPCSLPPLMRPSPEDASKAIETKRTVVLTRSFQSGNWSAFKKDVEDIRTHLKGTGTCQVPFADADYLLIAWVGNTELGETALLTAVVNNGAKEGYISRLPGLSAGGTPKLYQVFVSDDEHDVLASVYMSTREENPLLKQIPGVAEKILGPMLTLMSANMSTERGAKKRGPAAGGWATVSRVDLPYARASVAVEMKAALAPTEENLKRASTNLKNALTLIDVRYSKPAKDLAIALDGVVVAKAGDCIGAKAPSSCLAKLDPDFQAKYAASCPSCAEDDKKATQLVDGKFRALAAGVGAKELAGGAELRNAPLTKYSFGIMTGFSFLRSSSAPRVKIDDGVLDHDPLDRQLTMVTFNGAFDAYDADAFKMTSAEQHRWFAGAVIAPTFGVGFGYSFLPVRGLGINVGYAVLGVSVAEGDRKVGEAPADLNDPFKFGATGSAFFGLSYNFK